MEGSWGYCREYDIHKYRNMTTIISQLVTAVRYGLETTVPLKVNVDTQTDRHVYSGTSTDTPNSRLYSRQQSMYIYIPTAIAVDAILLKLPNSVQPSNSGQRTLLVHQMTLSNRTALFH